MGNDTNNKGFRIFGILTVVAVYFLILVGGIVRSTGSGMGCPDWPKCFGNVIPPTSVDELPANYKEIYAQKRFDKNKRVASLFSSLGFKDLSDRLLNDKSIYIEVDFNPLKTWIEYVNRLIGVAIGLFIIGFTVLSYRFNNTDPVVFYLSILSLVLVLVEGWLGSLVVSTNLLPFMVSIHMGLALLLVLILIYTVFRGAGYKKLIKTRVPVVGLNFLVIGMILATFFQIIVGTQVRENVDLVLENVSNRNLIFDYLGSIFYFHRSFSILLILGHVLIIYRIFKYYNFSSELKYWSLFIGIMVLASAITGMVLNYFGLPAYIQPVHLLLASLLIGGQFLLYLIVHTTNSVVKTS